MAEDQDDPFKKFGGKTINKPTQEEKDPFADFGGKTIKKKALAEGLSTPSSVATEELQPSSQTSSTTSGTNYPVGSLPEAGQVENNQFGFPSTKVPFAGDEQTIPATQLEEVQVTGTRTPKQETQPQQPEEHWYNTFGAMLQAIPKSVYETVGNVLKTEENSLKQKPTTKASTPEDSENKAKDYFKSVLGFFGDNMDTADAIKMGSPVTALKTISDKIINSGMSQEDKNRAIKELGKAQTAIQGRVQMMDEYAARNPYPHNIATNTPVAIAGMLPDLAFANLGGAGATGEAMAARVARMTEGAPAVVAKYAPKAAALLERAVKAPFTKVMAAKGAAEGGAKNESNPLLGVTTGAIKGAGEGIYMHVLGEGAGKVSPYIAKVIGKTGATSEISTALANPLANAGVFTAAKAIRTPIEEGRMATADELAHEAAMGVGFSLLHAGQTFRTHQEANHFYENTLKTDPQESLGRVLNEKPENILRDYDPNLNVKDLTEARNELKEAIVKEPDLEVKKQLGDEALKIQNQLDAKEAVEGIVKDKDALIEMVDKLPELTSDQKQEYIQKVTDIADHFNPVEANKRDLSDQIAQGEETIKQYEEAAKNSSNPAERIENEVKAKQEQERVDGLNKDLTKVVEDQLKPVEEVKEPKQAETTPKAEEAVKEPKTEPKEEVIKPTVNETTESSKAAPKTEETGTKAGEESVENRRKEELNNRVIDGRQPTIEDGEFKILGDGNNFTYKINESGKVVRKDTDGLWTRDGVDNNSTLNTAKAEGFEKNKDSINAKYDRELEESKPVETPIAKPKFTIKGETVTPKVEENVNTLNEPIVGGETKANAEDVQPTSNDKGRNGTQAETVAEETVKPSFDELATRSLEGDVIKNTLSNVERETNTKLDKTISEYNAADFKSAFVQGEQTVQAAKEEFGKDYVSKFTDYVKESKMPFENKAVMLVSLENDLRKQYLENPTPQLKKQVDLATKNSIEFLRSSARATGVGIFRQAARANYETEQASEAIFSPKERQERTKVEEAVQSTSEDVQKEYEARIAEDEGVVDAKLEQAIAEGVEKQINDIYDKLPTKRKERADKAIAALDKIQKNLRSKTYDAGIGLPIAVVDAGISTIKAAIKAGVNIADAIELGINKIKDQYGKKWAKEDEFRKDMLAGFTEEGIDIKDGKRTTSPEQKRATYIKQLERQITELDKQIEAGEKKVVSKEDKYKNDQEVEKLRETRDEKKDELDVADPSYKERIKLKSDLDKAQKSLDEWTKKLDDGDYSKTPQGIKEVNDKVRELREKRDAVKSLFESNKKAYEQSLITPESIAEKEVQRKVDANAKAISDLQDKLARNDLSTNTKNKSLWTSELGKLETEKAKLQKQLSDRRAAQEKANRPIKTEEENTNAKIESEVKASEKRIESLKAKLANNDLEVERKKSTVYSPELGKLKLEQEALTEELRNRRKTQDNALKQELIDAGYGKEITVTTKEGKEKRNIVDWKKLTGVEGSFDRMKENLEESFKKKGYSEEQINEFQKQLEDEYNDIHADIIQKSLNELNRRNTPREATAKTLARRLAELYNLGLYDRDVDTYSNILNNALGISPKSQAAFNEIRDFNRSLAQLLDSRGVNGKPLTDLEIITAENEIKAHIQKVIQKVQFAEGNGFFKFSDVMKNVFSAMQRMMLAKISQLVENPFSGALNDTQVKLQDAFSKGSWDTKELKANRGMLGRAIYEDASLRGGDEYGGVGNPFTSKNSIESFVNGLSKNAMYQSFVGMLSGRQYLDATDSYFKIKRTEKEFTNNLLRILTDKSNPNGAMEQNDALRFVSEALTGQSFNEAKETARGIITSINDKAGKEIIRPAETNVTRIANDLVKDNLVLGGKMTMKEVESAFKAAYKTAGKSIGHESNNILTDGVNKFSQHIQRELDDSLKNKEWSAAALLNLTSLFTKNIVNPFVGGGTNWTVIGLQKMGLPTEWLRKDVRFSERPLDLGTKEGLKNLEKSLAANAMRQRQFGRIMTGTLTALAAVMAVRYSGDEDDYKKWLKAHPDTRKLINKIQPVPLTLYLARDNKNNEFINAIASTLGSRYNAKTDGDKLYQAVNDFYEGYKKGNEKKTKKAWGTIGQLMGRRVNIPYVSSISNYGDAGDKLYKEFVGKPIKDPYKSPKGFVDGYFKGGLMDYLNITPQDLKEDKK